VSKVDVDSCGGTSTTKILWAICPSAIHSFPYASLSVHTYNFSIIESILDNIEEVSLSSINAFNNYVVNIIEEVSLSSINAFNNYLVVLLKLVCVNC
jgi:hypothetical protein